MWSGNETREYICVRTTCFNRLPIPPPPFPLGGFYSLDQLLNIHAFSFLRRWLLTNLSSGSAPSPTPTPTPTFEAQGQIPSSPINERRSISRTTPSYSFTSSLPSPLPSAIAQTITGSLTASLISPSRTRQGLKDAAVQYCLRVIEQCERSEQLERHIDFNFNFSL